LIIVGEYVKVSIASCLGTFVSCDQIFTVFEQCYETLGTVAWPVVHHHESLSLTNWNIQAHEEAKEKLIHTEHAHKSETYVYQYGSLQLLKW